MLTHLTRRPLAWATLLLTLALVSCGEVSARTTPTVVPGRHATATASATATPTTPPAPPAGYALAWSQVDATSTPQIWASINDGPATQITHFTQTGDGCGASGWGLPVFSPDLHYIAASLGYICGDGAPIGTVYVISVASGTMTPVPGEKAVARTSQRQYGWVDSSTLFIVNGGGLLEYTLGSTAYTELPGPDHIEEAVLRGSTLFYLRWDYSTSVETATLNRYDMNTHTAIGSYISLGQVHGCACSPGDYRTPGWDVSPDGSHVVYQAVTPGPGPDYGISTSHIYYAKADGSSASEIARYMTTNTLIRMRIAPNGQTVAFTTALPSPSVVTASVTSPGLKGDPGFTAHTPDAVAFPAWSWDSRSFIAATTENAYASPAPSDALMRYTPSTSAGTVYRAGGYNPWPTP